MDLLSDVGQFNNVSWGGASDVTLGIEPIGKSPGNTDTDRSFMNMSGLQIGDCQPGDDGMMLERSTSQQRWGSTSGLGAGRLLRRRNNEQSQMSDANETTNTVRSERSDISFPSMHLDEAQAPRGGRFLKKETSPLRRVQSDSGFNSSLNFPPLPGDPPKRVQPILNFSRQSGAVPTGLAVDVPRLRDEQPADVQIELNFPQVSGEMRNLAVVRSEKPRSGLSRDRENERRRLAATPLVQDKPSGIRFVESSRSSATPETHKRVVFKGASAIDQPAMAPQTPADFAAFRVIGTFDKAISSFKRLFRCELSSILLPTPGKSAVIDVDLFCDELVAEVSAAVDLVPTTMEDTQLLQRGIEMAIEEQTMPVVGVLRAVSGNQRLINGRRVDSLQSLQKELMTVQTAFKEGGTNVLKALEREHDDTIGIHEVEKAGRDETMRKLRQRKTISAELESRLKQKKTEIESVERAIKALESNHYAMFGPKKGSQLNRPVNNIIRKIKDIRMDMQDNDGDHITELLEDSLCIMDAEVEHANAETLACEQVNKSTFSRFDNARPGRSNFSSPPYRL